jgi:hypothetical protein
VNRAAGALALALLAVLAGWATRPGPSAAAEGPERARAVPAGPVIGQAPQVSDEPWPALPAPRADAGGLRDLLQRPVTELRRSVLQAQARHDEGGRLYARHLLRECAAAESVAGLHAPEGDDPGVIAVPDAGDPRAQQALSHWQALRAACAQFTPDEAAGGVNIGAADGAHDDPLLVLADRFAAASPDARRSRLREVLAHPDPLLLEELAPRLATRADDGPDPGVDFDGTRYPAEDAQAALALLPCAFGLPCDASDPLVWTSCLEGRFCAEDRAALVLHQSAPDDPQRQGRILDLSRRMADAVRHADADRFVPRT